MKNHGFSLLETIVYLGLFGILMSGVVVTVYQLMDAGIHNMKRVAIEEEGLFVNRKMNWALAGATAVSVPNPETLVITRPDLGAESPLTFTAVAGKIRLSRGSAAPLPLMTAELVVSSSTFSTVPAQGNIPASIHVSYKIEDVPFVFQTYLHSP